MCTSFLWLWAGLLGPRRACGDPSGNWWPFGGPVNPSGVVDPPGKLGPSGGQWTLRRTEGPTGSGRGYRQSKRPYGELKALRAPGCRRHGRGASLPASPYSFVNGHHVSRGQRAFDEPDVVLHSPQSLIFSSPSTTSTRSSGPSANRTWCFTPRKSLFFRRRAPRPSGPAGLRRSGRGASLTAIPYSFVRGHHVHEILGPTGSRR